MITFHIVFFIILSFSVSLAGYHHRTGELFLDSGCFFFFFLFFFFFNQVASGSVDNSLTLEPFLLCIIMYRAVTLVTSTFLLFTEASEII